MDVRILGPVEAWDASGAPIALGGRKQRALLAVLALSAGRTVGMSRLVDDLWGEDVPDTATKMVQIHVSQLRKVLPAGVLATRAPGYALDVPREAVDVFRAERLLREGREALDAGRPSAAGSLLAEALALWRGPALAEFSEPFAQGEVPRLEEMRLAALEARIDADLALGGHAPLVGELEALIPRHPLRERLRAQHILALYRSGRQAEALAAYQETRRALADELGIEPSAELRELERRILRQDRGLDVPGRAAAVAGRPAPAPASPTEPALVGRDAELARLGGHLERARAGSRQLVLVTGDAGLGKTTLVEAFLAGVDPAAALLVARGQCVDQYGASEAYLPVLDALSGLGHGHEGHALVGLLAERAPTWLMQLPGLAGPEALARSRERAVGATRDRMLREMIDVLGALAALRPLALVIEDLHWSDHSTVDLLGALSRRREPSRLLVLGTYRPAEAAALAHPVHALVEELRPRGLVDEIPLTPLSEADVGAYLTARLPGAGPSGGAVAALLERTHGNPLFVEKVVDDWIQTGKARREGGGWRLAADAEELSRDVPSSVRQLIRQRFRSLPPEDREALLAASVVGPEFSAALVAAAREGSEDEVEARCEELAATGSVIAPRGTERWPDGTIATRYGFTHELCREVLYEDLPAGRRARLHRRIGARLQAAWGERAPEIAAELSSHFLRGGESARAVEHLRLATRQALGRRAPREALDLARSGLALLERPDDGVDPRWEVELLTMLGAALIAAEGWSSEDAERAFLRARELAERSGGDEARATTAFSLGTFYEVQGEYRRSEALLEETLAHSRTAADAAVAVDLNELLACSLFHQGRFDRALQSAERALEVVESPHLNPFSAAYGDNPEVSCHVWAALSLWFLGRPDAARERAEVGVALAEHPSRRHGLSAARAYAALVSQLRQEPEATRRWADAAIEAATEGGFRYRLAMGLILRGWARAAGGAWEEGIAELRQGLDMSRATGARMDDAYYLGLLADACIGAGRYAQAIEALGRALDAVPRGGRFFWDAELNRLMGVALLATGDREEGEARLRRALDGAREQGSPLLELRAAVSLARLLHEEGRSAEAREVLVPAHEGLLEGSESADARDARALLAEVGAGAPAPEIRYARSGDVSVAYEVTGDGPLDLVLVPGFLSHLEMDRREPRHARFLARLAEMARLIRFDKRGTGLSDRPGGVADLETRMDDVRAVMDAAGSDRAVILGYSEGGPLSILFAATHPGRAAALVLVGAYAKRMGPDEDYPWARTEDARRAHIDALEGDWGYERHMRLICPSADDALARWWGERCRAAASPAAARALLEMNSLIDVRAVLPAIRVPTLVVHRAQDEVVRVEEARYLAARIPRARLVELPGRDHWVAHDPDGLLDALRAFLSEIAGPGGPREERVLATVLRAGGVDRAMLAREALRHAGAVIDSEGAPLALFDGPARAIRCGLALQRAATAEGRPARIGLHTGEVVRRESSVEGVPIRVASAVCAEAAPGEVLVSATLRDLVAGSDLAFADRGERSSAGLGERRRLYAAMGPSGSPAEASRPATSAQADDPTPPNENGVAATTNATTAPPRA
jgi:DNA-binding SARP family transcriptional activator/pimeloyl-ACP methyl ester carboxylesterase